MLRALIDAVNRVKGKLSGKAFKKAAAPVQPRKRQKRKKRKSRR